MNIVQKYFKLFLIAFVCLLYSCEGKDEPITQNKTKRTILVYMIATNSLGYYDWDSADIAEMESYVKNNDMNDCRLLVYHVQYSSAPSLYEIKNDNGTVVHKTLKMYNKNVSSVTYSQLKTVISDMQNYAPADDYGIIFWSHGTGWAPSLTTSTVNFKTSTSIIPPNPISRTFGIDYNKTMPIDQLASAIPDNLFSFIYMDACYMGGIETAYQLRNKTKYYISSPTSIPSSGMPYDKNLAEFTKDYPDYKAVCENTYHYYDTQSGINHTATISLVDCTKLDRLASICKEIYKSTKIVEKDSLQGYITASDGLCIYYDFEQYLSSLATTEQLIEFQSSLPEVITYKAATEYIFGILFINPEHYSGLSVYYPGSGNKESDDYYKTLDWYNATH